MAGARDILIATTRSDDSLRYFLKDGVHVVYFEDQMADFSKKVTIKPADIVYIRDPFNTGTLPHETIFQKIDILGLRQSTAYFVDNVKDHEGVLIEDKWRQYQKFQNWMPRTELGGNAASELQGNLVAKKRISARSRHVLFVEEAASVSSEWILQQRLEILEELRVYILFGEPVPLASMRRSHKPGQPTRVTGLRMLASEEQSFVDAIADTMAGIDFAGLDIARTPQGLKLIEMNRSPQFYRYNELSGQNLVAGFWESILT